MYQKRKVGQNQNPALRECRQKPKLALGSKFLNHSLCVLFKVKAVQVYLPSVLIILETDLVQEKHCIFN